MPGGKEIKKDEKIEREPLDMSILDKQSHVRSVHEYKSVFDKDNEE